MNELLKAAIVRIFIGDTDNPVGLGFLASENHIFTCAHVVAQATGTRKDSPDAPTNKINLDFPLIAAGKKISAHVVFWEPVQVHPSPTEEREDIAILELEAGRPSESRPAHMVIAKDLWKHHFAAFGFPKGYDEGVWAEGELLDKQAQKRIQLEAVKVPGYRVMQGFSGTPVWDSQLNGVIGMVVESDKQEEVKAAYATPTDILLSTWPGLSQPYRGLAYFHEEDSIFFHGREVYIQRLLESVQKKPLVIVTGPSGSGKSSVIFAGLIPQLRKLGEWLIIPFRPGGRPFHALAAVLLPLLETKMNETDWLLEIKKLGDRLQDGDLELQDVIERILQKNPGYEHLLLCGDQFEELYTSYKNQEKRQYFLELLLPTTNLNSQMFTLVITLRADFLGQALSDPPFADAFNHASQESTLKVLTSMSRQELRNAIEMPAKILNIEIQAGLTDRILDAIDKQAGSLPLLEFALTLLWEKQEKSRLTHNAYDQIGGVENALASYAEQSYKKFNEKEQQQVQRIFIQLVHLSEDTKVARRVATHSEIGEDNWNMVIKLADTRLVVTGMNEASGEEIVEVVHEALIERWERLRQWVEKDREFRIWQDRLRNALDLWKSSNKDDEALLRGTLLAGAEEWLAQRPDAIGKAEHGFIVTSGEHYKNQVVEEALTTRDAIDKLNDFLGWFLIILEITILLRSFLKLLGANANTLFTSFNYALTDIILLPFSNIAIPLTFGDTHILEWSAFSGIISYWVIFWAIRRFLRILVSRPGEPI